MNPHETPLHIFTSYIGVSHICFRHRNADVTLLGCYGDLATGEMKPITIETNFETLNELLYSIDDQADDAIDALVKSITEPSEDYHIIELADQNGIHFNDHIFALMRIREDDENTSVAGPEDVSYVLNAYIKRKEILPEFITTDIPTSRGKYLSYCNRLLAIRYRFYLLFGKTMNRLLALSVANLSDPLTYAMAKTQYKVIRKTSF
jgi:hypothetical protein